MNHSRRRVAAAALAAALAVLAPFAGASAAVATSATVTLSEEDLAYFHETADRFGVDAATQEALLTKVEAGIPLDSSTGASPVSVVTADVDGFHRTVETFADGSIIGTDLEIPVELPEGVSARGVSGCVLGTSAGVSYGQDCWIYSSSLTMGASFYSSYSRWSGGSSVWNWHSPAINIVGGSVTSQSWVHTPGGTTSSIQLQWNSQTGGVFTSNTWLRFNVSSTGGVSQTRGGAW
ncbi:hypothetical protein [Leifsonia sp. NPDC080035]|uniref:Uncharacterized protein n=1 Tax=Leifsonia sp. NPDC080035 TaxID=3143936 RepID=A0AAU7G989_9MICO